MKLNYIFLYVLLVFCCNNASAQNTQPAPAEDSTVIADSMVMMADTTQQFNYAAQSEPDTDSAYKVGDFLFPGKKGLAFDFYKNGHRPKVLKSNGDTLYHDKEYTILANSAEAWNVYKKIKLKYSFDMFKVKSIYTGKMAKPNFKTDPEDRKYRTMIRYGCANDSITFAGHYTIAEWGCGAACGEMTVINRISGRIYNSYEYMPFDSIDGHYGIRYQKDSRLIIVNSSLLDDYPGYCEIAGDESWRKLSFYEWKGNGFVKLK